MANREKYTRSAIGHMCKHYGRQKDEKENYCKFGNQDIDYERTHLNYNLAATDQPKDQQEFIKERMKKLKCLNRKNVNVMMSWLVTLPKEMNEKPMSEQRKFFEKSIIRVFKRALWSGQCSVCVCTHGREPTTHALCLHTRMLGRKS